MATFLLNNNLTQIAAKRLSGKAMTNSKLAIPEEAFGSSVQTLASTVFAEVIPNEPNNASNQIYLIQSESNAQPGTVMLVDFDVVPIGSSQYINTVDGDSNADLYAFAAGTSTGQNTTNTYHAYVLKLTGSFQADLEAIGATYFGDNASTGTALGSAPFVSGFTTSGSLKLQIVPEYASTLTSGNPYVPKISQLQDPEDFANPISATSPEDIYLDPFAGILFIQDPVDYATGTGNVPGKVRAFIYVGKYQDEVTFTANDVNFIVSGSDEGFAVGNDDTINFVSGSAGITVESNSSAGTITIGESTDNVTFNQITASIINADIIEASEYIVSSSITYFTQSFSAGSTIFGDTNNDTHEFTGSLLVLHTGSNYGIDITGSGIIIDSGDISISASGDITASGLYLYNDFTALDGGVTVTSNTSPELYVAGNITASGNISASGYLQALANDAGGTSYQVSLYDNATGKFYYTASSAIQGDTTDIEADITLLQASASAGIHFMTGSAPAGTSISLTGTASFVGHPAAGLVVDETSGVITYSILPDTLVAATSDDSLFYFTSSKAITASYITTAQTASYVDGANVDGAVTSATSASVITVTNNGTTAGAQAIIFAEPDTGNDVSLQSDATTFTYDPGTNGGQLKIGDANFLTIDKNAIGTSNTTFALLNGTATTINFGGAAEILNMGASNGTATIKNATINLGESISDIVNVKGTASIEGDLIVKGNTTQLQVTNLNVEDQFILLNSGAAVATDTGIIVQTGTTQNQGSALYWDTGNSRWEIDFVGANASSNTAAGDAAIVAVRTGSSSTPSDPYMGTGDAGIGQMYVDTSNPDDGNPIWIYA